MLEKGYGVGKGIFTNPSQNDSVLSQHDSSKKIKQDKQKNNSKPTLYPSLQTEDRRFQSEQGNNKRQEPASKINKPSEQPSDGEDDDNQDYRMLLTELEELNLSDIVSFDNTLTNEEGKKQERKKVKEPEQFLQMLTELNKAEEKQEKDEIISKLNQNEVKNLILGSYFNKILSSNGFINDLEYILEFCQGGTRLPSYSKRTLLLFLEEVIQQVDLNPKEFSITNYKFKIDRFIPEAISFGQNLQNHFGKEKRQMFKKLIYCYMNMDYIHAEAKNIFHRNTKKIVTLYKQYIEKTKPSKQAKKFVANQAGMPTRSQSYQLNSQITQSQDFYFEPKQAQLAKKQTQSTYNYSPQNDEENLFEVRSMAFARSKEPQSQKIGQKFPLGSENDFKIKKKNSKIQQIRGDSQSQKNSKPSEKNDNFKGQQKKSNQQKKSKDHESQTQRIPFQISQFSVDLDFKKPQKNLKYETAGNSPRLLTSSEYCKSIFGGQSPNTQTVGTKPNDRKIEKPPNYNSPKTQKLQYSYISDNLESDQQQLPNKPGNSKNKPQQFFNSNSKQQDFSLPESFNISLSLATSKNISREQIILLDRDQKYVQDRNKEVLVQATTKQQKVQKESSSDEEDVFQSDSDSSGNQYTNQLLDMTRIIDASLNSSSKKIKAENNEDSWVSIESKPQQKIFRKAVQERKEQKRQIRGTEKTQKISSPHSNSNSSSSNQSYRKLGNQLKQKLPPLLEQFQEDFVKYQKSKPQFHVGPRRRMFNFLDEICVNVQKLRKSAVPASNSRNKDEELGVKLFQYFSEDKIKQLKQIFVKHNADYFPQPPKLGMFADVKTLIKLYKEYK